MVRSGQETEEEGQRRGGREEESRMKCPRQLQRARARGQAPARRADRLAGEAGGSILSKRTMDDNASSSRALFRFVVRVPELGASRNYFPCDKWSRLVPCNFRTTVDMCREEDNVQTHRSSR